MPVYTYQCSACAHEFDEFVPLADYDKPQPCPRGDGAGVRVFGARAPGFVLRGDGWPGKNLRISNQMARKNQVLAKKERDVRANAPTLVPNVEGEQTDSWSDAAKLAKDRGKDAASYEPFVRKEHADP